MLHDRTRTGPGCSRARPDDTLLLEDGTHERTDHPCSTRNRDRLEHPARHERGGSETVVRRQPRVRPRPRPEARHPPRPVCRPGAHRARPRPRARRADRQGAGRPDIQDGGVPVRRVPARPAPHEQPAQPRHRRADAAGPHGTGAGPGRAGRAGGGTGPRQRRPRAAGVVLHGLDGVARRPSDRVRHPLRVRHLRPGHQGRLAGGDHRQVAAQRQSLGDPAAGGHLRGAVRRPHREVGRRPRSPARPLGAPRRGQGRGVRHTHPRLSRPDLQHAPPLEGRGRGVVRLRSLQPRRLLPRRGRQDGLGEHHEGALPERRGGAGQDPAAAAAVLFRELLAAGHDPAASAPGPAARGVPRHLGRPAQRHAPGHRRGGADAAARRRARAALGHGVERHPENARVHEPHPPARGAGEVDRGTAWRAPAPPSRDHLRDQPPVRRPDPRAVPGRRGARGAHVDHRRGRRAGCAHGAPRHGRQPHGQRRRRAAFPAAHRNGAARLLRAVAGEVRERHQRRHAAAVRGGQQPAAGAAPHRAGRRRLAEGPAAGSAASSRWQTTRSSAANGAR